MLILNLFSKVLLMRVARNTNKGRVKCDQTPDWTGLSKWEMREMLGNEKNSMLCMQRSFLF